MQLHRQAQPWGQELSGFGRPMGLGRDAAGGLMVTDMDRHLVCGFAPDLTTCRVHDGISGWQDSQEVLPGHVAPQQHQPSEVRPGGLHGPHSVADSGDGDLIVTCYYTPRLVALRRDGTVQTLADAPLLRGPATARLGRTGHLLVSEYARNELLVLDIAGGLVARIGNGAPQEQGAVASGDLGSFDRPHMALQDAQGRFVVADTWNHRLQRFTPEGRFDACLNDASGWQTTLPSHAAPRLLDCPVALDLDTQGRMLVTCWGTNQILLFDAAGQRMALAIPAPLRKPYDARFWEEGIVVADSHQGRVLLVDNPAWR